MHDRAMDFGEMDRGIAPDLIGESGKLVPLNPTSCRRNIVHNTLPYKFARMPTLHSNAQSSAGSKVVDEFYGDRARQIKDPSAHLWHLSTHKEDLSMEEMRERFDAMVKGSQLNDGRE